MTNRKVFFVTGSSGFIGKVFTKRLVDSLSETDKIYLLVRVPPVDSVFINNKIVFLTGQLSEISNFKEQLLESNYVYHLAANATFGNDKGYYEDNVHPVKEVIDILKESSQLKRLIFTSTIGAVDRAKDDRIDLPLSINSIPSPTSYYGKSKLEAEKNIQSSGIPYVIIRPTWVYGRGMRIKSHINVFANLIYAKSIVSRFGFNGKVSIIHVDDLSIALLNCSKNDIALKPIYFAEAEMLSFKEIFRIISDKLGYTSKSINIPRFKFIFSRIHSILPLTITNLFLDYLTAKDDFFQRDLLNSSHISFNDGVKDVINSNPNISGYWIITGANSGIGNAIFKKLKASGMKTILIDKDISNISDAQNESCKIFECDLSSNEQIQILSEKLNKYPIHTLINNAGVGFKGGFRDLTENQILKTIEINIRGTFLLIKKILPILVRDNSNIVNIASSVAFNPLPGMSIYAASKAFVLNMSEALSYELKASNKVITFCPSGTNTNFQHFANVKKEDSQALLSPEYIAEEIIKSTQKSSRTILIGLKSKILNTTSLFLPRKLTVIIHGKLFNSLR